jgi:hypothetical protein
LFVLFDFGVLDFFELTLLVLSEMDFKAKTLLLAMLNEATSAAVV